ncbi:hypothetical protein B5S33_g4739 [[Candida] boidinii]|nr:hypothetical protein B5S33_g4739 [[Candida] boidinii]GMF99269.1 unnamed protein product [[Candida] boidinii]
MLRSKFRELREYLTPISHVSTFDKSGEITPEEFILAGDYLVYKFPTWSWSSAPENKRKDFLPPDKQFLVTKHVPSYIRASDYESDDMKINEENETLPSDSKATGGEENKEGEEEGWSNLIPTFNKNTKDTTTTNDSTGTTINDEQNNEIGGEDISLTSSNTSGHRHCNRIEERRHSKEFIGMKETENVNRSFSKLDINNDIDELIDENAEGEIIEPAKFEYDDEGDISNLPPDSNKRSYDLYIAYSTSYRVPKMYLVGFDNEGVPLKPDQMFEDIASDYREKTVTIEKAPFLNNTTSVSIHPCRHAVVMKALMKRAKIAAKNKKLKELDKISKISKLGLADNGENDEDEDDEWENVNQDQEQETDDDANVVRVDQYLIIFLKFISSVTPGIEHDYTMDAF